MTHHEKLIHLERVLAPEIRMREIKTTHFESELGVPASTYFRWLRNGVPDAVIQFAELCDRLDIDLPDALAAARRDRQTKENAR